MIHIKSPYLNMKASSPTDYERKSTKKAKDHSIFRGSKTQRDLGRRGDDGRDWRSKTYHRIPEGKMANQEGRGRRSPGQARRTDLLGKNGEDSLLCMYIMQKTDFTFQFYPFTCITLMSRVVSKRLKTGSQNLVNTYYPFS